MAENKIELKSIRELLGMNFFIPSYQRGYRWTDTQVTQLLDDIWQFTIKDYKTNGEFYCLQPVVVKVNNNDKWDVIDGQQRITTLFIVIKYLEDIVKIAFQNFSLTSPHYETRDDSKDFLENVKTKTELEAKQNVDYFHIWKAYHTIKKWFENKEKNINSIDFVNTLLKYQFEKYDGKQIDIANNVRVIWYEVNEEETNNSIDIFTRLNIGKIPLTNAELIKALFLQKGNFSEKEATLKQIQIATEWENIEKTLQDDTFWYFIYNPSNPLHYDNRIEYIFDLMKGRTKESEYYHTFNEFYKDFSSNKKDNKPDIDKIWLGIKQYFLTFEEWFKDYELFHYVGYLIDCVDGKNEQYSKNIINRITELKTKSKTKNKKEFKEHLKLEISKQVNYDIDNLEYGNKQIRKVLLLFNIQTVLQTQKSDMRFPFHKYKSEDWDIEHVRSQNDKEDTGKIKGNPDEWVSDIFDFFIGSDNDTEIKEFVARQNVSDEIKNICNRLFAYRQETDKNGKQTKFESAYKLVQGYFKESDSPDNINSISNLALLDAATNRSYGNAFFPIKRKRIIENDKNGVFVPICTKNLFLKYYSKKLGEVMYWNNDDANDYLQAIKETLAEFLPQEKLESIITEEE
jgi:uncharacterized protein with ParB-like and HNH nuclease domain